MASLRTAPGMRERSPGVWELVVQAGRDPVTGKRRQASRMFRGNLRDAKKARAALLVEVSKGRHTGSRATLDDLFAEWIIELRRKGRSPNTVARLRAGLQAQHPADARHDAGHQGHDQDAHRPVWRSPEARARRRAACTRSTRACRRCSPRRAAGGGATRTRRSGPSRRRSPTSSRPCRHLRRSGR